MAPVETPELLQTSLLLMDQELYTLVGNRLQIRRMQPQQSPPYEKEQRELKYYEAFAASLSSSVYLQSTDLRLRYLRADLFDAKRAAARMVDHHRLLFKYFDMFILHRPLMFKDLGDLEQDALRQGVYQVLPSRDRAKRLILYHHGAFRGKAITNLQRIRVTHYFNQVLSEDVETQKNGLVFIFSTDASVLQDVNDPEYHQDWKDTVGAHPLRWSAFHLCLPPGPTYQLLKAFLLLTVGTSQERVRAKVYPDLISLETQYKLMSFGIPIQELPISCTGTVKLKNLHSWIQSRMAIDEARQQGFDTSSLILHPGTRDVLFSKGGNARNQGNLEFHQLMEARILTYNGTSSRKEKREIRDGIISTVCSRSGRFLEMTQTGVYWVEILDMETLHSKVTSALNDFTRTMKARQNRQRSESDTHRFIEGKKRRKLENACCM
ncbi:MAG: hypothetical protein SGILL_001833 [Bacillariaceae sp.]